MAMDEVDYCLRGDDLQFGEIELDPGEAKTARFGGEVLFFFDTLKGPGTGWLQSLPVARLASRIFAVAPRMQGGGDARGEQGV
ncbi:hypothetical protein [Hydrogenophaga sp. PAMC20947]|uniref:hypothetical protein n=1 Tax=Hydrogenophaga sp. PAMC20947 TaxID=2565558 RepID=UPI00109DE731|nr:hypothetical protein [Hydrogenophaga sp. PAMC20947]QCB44775.1 hypothetical protein E5678_01195 [Hydrogenophaga sp. PAMC20947]